MAKCNLDKVNLKLMLPAVSPSLHMICGGALRVRKGKLHTALPSSDRYDQCFCERIFADSLAFISLPACNFFSVMPRSTQNSQAMPLVKVGSDGNHPSSCSDVSVSVTG